MLALLTSRKPLQLSQCGILTGSSGLRQTISPGGRRCNSQRQYPILRSYNGCNLQPCPGLCIVPICYCVYVLRVCV
jgi:hypothetical protein